MAISFLKLWDNLKPLTRLRGFRFPRCIKSAEEFLQILRSERARADGYFSILIISKMLYLYLENLGSSQATVRRLSHLIARRVCYTDQVGWLDRHSFTVLLPDTSARGARNLARKISNAIAETDSPPACRVYTYPIHKYRSIINRFSSPAPENGAAEINLKGGKLIIRKSELENTYPFLTAIGKIMAKLTLQDS